ncbi:hypothetical protein ACWOFR_15565 [Carnobacterium gallinarum]|uniref:hypothetical protein n=1 Tax=Carnobacterium gallinarum TaxID=2749 RepID=UPI000554EA15|nr:hypothetical protein [Carnobacterium gallinarum]
MKKQKVILATILTAIFLLTIYQNNTDKALPVVSANTISQTKIKESTIITNPVTNENVTTQSVVADIDTKNNSTITSSEIPIELTPEEAAASQQDPITIDLTYQGTWKSLDGSQTIIGDSSGFKFDGAPFGWLVRYAKTDNALIFGDTNYRTFSARLTDNDHLIIEKIDGSQTTEFTREYQ